MKKNSIFILLLLLIVFACQKQEQKNESQEKSAKKEESTLQQTEVSSATLISCEGIGKVKFSMTYADLEKAFGKDKLLTDTVLAGTLMMDGERSSEDRIYTTITAPEGKIYIDWAEGKEAKKIEKISITIGDNPKYKFADGIGIGSTLAELKKANQQDFEFYGFGWEYGGAIINETAKGKFFEQNPCFTGDLRTKDDNYDKVQNLMGDGKFKSSAANDSQAQEIILSGITLIKK